MRRQTLIVVPIAQRRRTKNRRRKNGISYFIRLLFFNAAIEGVFENLMLSGAAQIRMPIQKK
jgi:hypothetical protein